jgi:hypothetical protein
VKLFIILIAPFVAFVLFVQAARFVTTVKTNAVRWRGGLRTRDESPTTYWLLIIWNIAVTIGILFIYGRMVLREFE